MDPNLHIFQPDTNKAIVVQRRADAAVSLFHAARTGVCLCIHCGASCWLGNESLRRVLAGEFLPLCEPCAATILRPEDVIGMVVDT